MHSAGDLEGFVCRQKRGEVAQFVETVVHLGFVYETQPTRRTDSISDSRQ